VVRPYVQDVCLPLFTSISVMVCHLSMATNHLGSASCSPCWRRQLRSMTNLSLSPPRAARTASRRGWLNLAFGNKKDVMMTY
jgi:hypothetical protein